MSRKNILIIHFNTPYVTSCLIKSINKYVDNAFIYLFDNSDKEPFTEKFDNVILLDNTKGQIIDFDKWLEKYPRRIYSPGRVNKWASAKHCYSVDKCMDIINDNFILLDSDVLVTNDFSELYNDEFIYAGEIINQPNSIIKRVLPYICFINVNKCFENGIRYFDDNYMHGLANAKNNIKSDSYDTGAGFYVKTNDFKHNIINGEDYIIHYGHGSWDKKNEKKTISANEWVNLNKKYWSKDDANKNVLYTCITGDYDYLKDPNVISNGFDYVCFTDSDSFKSNVWEIRKLPKETDGLTVVKKQRYVKINAHKVLPEYDLSIWVDGNVAINGDLNDFIKEKIADNKESVFVPEHPKRTCIYDEAIAVISMKKDVKEKVNPQIEKYKKEGFPKKYGLLQSNIMVRRHNEKDCIKLMECWFNEIKNHSHRDQLSFNYALWKNKDVKVVYLEKTICSSKWFKWLASHGKHSLAIKNTTTDKKTNNNSNITALKERLNKIKEANQLRRKKIIEENEKLVSLNYIF